MMVRGPQRLWNVLRTTTDWASVNDLAVAADMKNSRANARRLLRLWAAECLCERRDDGPKIPGAGAYYRGIAGMAPIAPRTRHPANGSGVVEWSMSGAEFGAIRQRLGLSLTGYGAALGFAGRRESVMRAVRRLEAGQSIIGPDLAAKARAL